MRSSHEVEADYAALDAALARTDEHCYDALSTPDILSLLERLDRVGRLLPVPGHALIKQLKCRSRQSSSRHPYGRMHGESQPITYRGGVVREQILHPRSSVSSRFWFILPNDSKRRAEPALSLPLGPPFAEPAIHRFRH